MKKKIKRALISISNKTNLKTILKILKKYNIEIISSGGTFKEIKKLKYNCIDVSNYTGFSEILGGRVKTLHPKIHSGILYKRNNKNHQKEMINNKFKNIDLVIVNFYPFEKTLNANKNQKEIIENIDIGGPALVRSAAKNFNDVTVITSIKQYDLLKDELEKYNGSTTLKLREKLSQLAFTETAYYDSVISGYFNKITKTNFPTKKIIHSNLIEKLRYGENPHQEGAVYSTNEHLNISQLHGKKLSYNNFNDIYSALSISNSLPKSTGTVIIKHANPCGVSIKSKNIDSYNSALQCDPISAFGGVVSCNFKIKTPLAKELNKIFLEVIIGKGFDANAIKLLKKRKNLRIIDSSNFDQKEIIEYNSINESFLFQSRDEKVFSKKNFKVVSKIKPNKYQMDNLIFAFNVCRFVKSNAIVLVNNKTTIGIGSGQPSRLDSCELAIRKMKKFNKESLDIVAASDAFFPFVDGVEKLIQSGVKAIIQPSGSINDKEIIKFANQTNTVLVFSKTRHFKH